MFVFRSTNVLSFEPPRNKLEYQEVLQKLADKGISIRVASPKLVMEEAPESYKDVTEVVDTCKTFTTKANQTIIVLILVFPFCNLRSSSWNQQESY